MVPKLLLIAIGVIAYLLLRRWLARREPMPPPASSYAPMVSCMTCGLHLPRENAVENQGRFYCSREHADQASR